MNDIDKRTDILHQRYVVFYVLKMFLQGHQNSSVEFKSWELKRKKNLLAVWEKAKEQTEALKYPL